MMKKFIKVTILLVLLTLMLLSSCLVGFAIEKVITFARPQDCFVLDPFNTGQTASKIFELMLFDRLVDWDPEAFGTRFVPSLATEWKMSFDGKEWTFKLREGVKFHNGEPFNAECVKVTLERFFNEDTLITTIAPIWREGLKEVEVVDDYTVILRFNDPNIFCLNILALTPIFPAKAFKEKGLALFDNPIGTGPFTFGYLKRGQEVVFNKNPDYWGKPVYMDKFVYLPIIEKNTRLAGVLTGEIDICDTMTAEDIPVAEASDNVEVSRMSTLGQIFFALKTDKPPFTDIKFRQAIALGVDREGILKNIMKGGRVSTGVLPQGVFGFDDSLVPAKQDIEKAKQLVKESVYDGRTIELIVPIGWYPNEKALGEAIRGNFKEIGINCKLSILEQAVFRERRAMGDYDIFLGQDSIYSGDVSDETINKIVADVYHMSDGNLNPEVKKLILEQAITIDKQKRIELLRKMENLINIDFAPLIMFIQMEQIFFQQKGIQGAIYYGNRVPDLRYAHYKDW
jgi:ABC-type transport system substrate-binding protein